MTGQFTNPRMVKNLSNKGIRGQQKYRKGNRYVIYSSYSSFDSIKELTRSEEQDLVYYNTTTTKEMAKAIFGGHIFGHLTEENIRGKNG